KDPAPIAVVTSYKENHVNITMRYWIETSKFWGVRFYLNKTAVQELQKVGLRHPIPVREVQNISEQNKAARESLVGFTSLQALENAPGRGLFYLISKRWI